MTMLSIVMPVYNESRTVVTAIERVLAVDYPCPVELIVVDDGSVDDTPELLSEFADRGVQIVRHDRNSGKSAAVRTGAKRAKGTHLIILDADLEYAPSDIVNMLMPVIQGRTDHVFGARVFGLGTSFPSFRFAVGGRFLTLTANLMFDSCLTDMHTCLKLIPLSDFHSLRLTEEGFGLDTELTAGLLRAGVRPFEVPVSYYGRPVEHGKKITWRDGVHCLRILARVRLSAVPPLAHPRTVHAPVVVPAQQSAPIHQSAPVHQSAPIHRVDVIDLVELEQRERQGHVSPPAVAR